MTQLISNREGNQMKNPARRLRFINREYQVPLILYNQVFQSSQTQIAQLT